MITDDNFPVHAMLDTVPICSSVWDREGHSLWCNDAALSFFGLNKKQEYLNHYSELSPEQQPCGKSSDALMATHLSQAFAEGRNEFSWLYRRLNGLLMPVHITLTRIGQNKHALVVAYVTEQSAQSIADARDRDELRSRLMLDNAPLGCTLWNERGEIVDCNEEILRWVGLNTREEFLERVTSFWPEEQPGYGRSVEQARETMALAFRTGWAQVPWMQQVQGGELIPCDATLIRTMEGDEPLLAIYIRDLSEQKRIEAAKFKAEEHAKIMLDATPLGCTLWDEGSRLIDCNQEAVRLFGMGTKQELLDRFFELSPEYQPDGNITTEMYDKYIQQAHRDGIVRINWLHRTPDSSMIPAEITLVRVQREEGHVIAAYIRDLREEKRLQAASAEADEYTRLMLDNAPFACTFRNDQGEMLGCNLTTLQLFGFSSIAEFTARYTEVTPDCQPCGTQTQVLRSRIDDQVLQNGRMTLEWMCQTLKGEPMPCEITVVPLFHAGKTLLATFIRDLRENKKLQAEKEEAREYAQLMQEVAPLACVLLNEEHDAIACNPALVSLFGLSGKQEFLQHFFDFSPEYQPCGRQSKELARVLIKVAFDMGHSRFEWLHQKRNGELIPSEITLERIHRNQKYIVAGYIRDLRELRETVTNLRRLESIAYIDKLTGIANRRGFFDNALAELAKLSPGDSAHLMIFDIDHFKRVNDNYSHSAGDEVLKCVAQRVQKILRPYDLFARYGGEEFVILLTQTDQDVSLSLAERVREAVAQTPFGYQGKIIGVTISIGVTSCGGPSPALQEMIDHADTALYQAKDQGRNRVVHRLCSAQP